MKSIVDVNLDKLEGHSFSADAHVVTLSIAQDAVEATCKEVKEKAIEAFKENCQHPKDAEGCECKLCVRNVGGHCELLEGFIEKLNSI